MVISFSSASLNTTELYLSTTRSRQYRLSRLNCCDYHMEIIVQGLPMEDTGFTQKLEIKFENRKPVLVEDLSNALLSVSDQYARFVETTTTERYVTTSELFVKDVRSGSMVFDIVGVAMPIIPLLWEGGSLSEWVGVAKGTMDWLLAKKSTPPVETTKPDLQNWMAIMQPVAKDHGAQLIFSASGNATVTNNLIITSAEAGTAQKTLQRLLAEADTPANHVHRRKVMIWYQTRFDSTDTGDKVIIEDISTKPTKVIFENQAVKAAMLRGDPRFIKPWNELAYIVDVRVQTVRGVPKLYEVVDYHDEHTFDPND